ncbi:ankyrin repeat-containing domain protein, partial [Baffinella frigidus]
QAKALDEIGRQIDASRITSDEAAMALAERSQDERHATRLAEKIAREDKEEKSRPDRVWKAVKDGKERLVAELLEKPFKQSKPAVPLIQMRDVSGWTLCHWAAFFNHRDVIITLLKHGHPLSPVDGTGNTPLHLAAFNGSSACCHKIAETEGGDVAHEKLVNQPNVFGSTPLMEAACNEHGAVSAELFQAKGDWNPSDDAHRRRSQSPPTSTHSGGHSHSPRPKSRGHTPGGERGHTRSPGPAARGVSPVAKTRHKPQSSIH